MIVILDFSGVDIVTSSGIAKLIALRNLLSERRRSLVLCGASEPVKCIFSVCGLDRLFEFADDKTTAIICVYQRPRLL